MSKSGKTHFHLSGGAQRVPVHSGKRDAGRLGKEVARKMIQMRLSGLSQAECDAWLEDAIQEIEKAEREAMR